MSRIFHIVKREAWDVAKTAGTYRAESLTTEGYIHCSTDEQMQATANRYYQGQHGMILIEIDPARVQSPLKFEPAGNWLLEHPGEPFSNYTGELFPHLYGPLNPDAVIAEIPYEPGADGSFPPIPA